MSMEKYLKELIIYHLKQKLGRLQQELEYTQEPPPNLKILSYRVIIGYIDIVTEK